MTRFSSTSTATASDTETLASLTERGRQEAERTLREARESARAARLARAIGHTGIPPRFLERTLERFDPGDDPAKAHALRTAWRYAESFQRVRRRGVCLQLLGGPGTGKTHLACGILHAIIEQGYTGLFIGLGTALRMIRATYQAGSTRTEQDVINTLAAPDLLVLDEIGVAIGRDDTRKTMLYDVLDARYLRRAPTVLIGNLTGSEMAAYLGERLVERLIEDGVITVSCNWTSYRRQAPGGGGQ